MVCSRLFSFSMEQLMKWKSDFEQAKEAACGIIALGCAIKMAAMHREEEPGTPFYINHIERYLHRAIETLSTEDIRPQFEESLRSQDVAIELAELSGYFLGRQRFKEFSALHAYLFANPVVATLGDVLANCQPQEQQNEERKIEQPADETTGATVETGLLDAAIKVIGAIS